MSNEEYTQKMLRLRLIWCVLQIFKRIRHDLGETGTISTTLPYDADCQLRFQSRKEDASVMDISVGHVSTLYNTI